MQVLPEQIWIDKSDSSLVTVVQCMPFISQLGRKSYTVIEYKVNVYQASMPYKEHVRMVKDQFVQEFTLKEDDV